MNDGLPLTDARQATPAWLTRTLQSAGCLPSGAVTGVRESSRATVTSVVSQLDLTCSADAPRSAPSRLFLKISRSVPGSSGDREVEFYRTVAAAMPDPPSPRCYDAAFSASTGRSHLLLQDLSASHSQTEGALPPTQAHCEQTVDCLAAFHAFWWEHPKLGRGIGQIPGEAAFQASFQQIERGAAAFLDFLGDRLSGERRQLYRRVVAALPGLWKRALLPRLAARKALTLIHGDAHPGSFFYPRQPGERVRAIDWQFWDAGVATDDLAYMIALHWYPERRRRLETGLVRSHHQGLLQRGVQGYNWDDCWYDYRVSAIKNLFVPVRQWASKVWVNVWWSHLERAVLAFEDLGCERLLEENSR